MVIVEESGCSSAILSDHVRIQIVLQAQGRRLIRLPSLDVVSRPCPEGFPLRSPLLLSAKTNTVFHGGSVQ